MSAKEEYTQIIKDVYSINSFVKLCGMELVDVECGKVTLAMPIDAAKHTNLYEVAHGGSLAALADTALGMASASVGARVVTINYTINFIKNLHAGDVATAVGTVIQRGHKIIIIKVETFNNEGTLLTEMLGTMYVIGKFETIPENGNGVISYYEKNLANYKVYNIIFSVAYSSSHSNKYNIFDSFEIKYKRTVIL